MRLRNIKRAKEVINSSAYIINNKEQVISFYKNNKKLFIEIGMGKGQFIISNALKYKENDYIGIERYESVALRAVEKLNTMEEPLVNLRLMCVDATYLSEYIDEHTVDGIYLNFSDPWSKKRHENRRLTSIKYLKLYRSLLKSDGFIEQKTDNTALFDFSIEKLKENGYNIEYITYDLYSEKSLLSDNIPTEYENKFHILGNRIHKLKAIPN